MPPVPSPYCNYIIFENKCGWKEFLPNGGLNLQPWHHIQTPPPHIQGWISLHLWPSSSPKPRLLVSDQWMALQFLHHVHLSNSTLDNSEYSHPYKAHLSRNHHHCHHDHERGEMHMAYYLSYTMIYHYPWGLALQVSSIFKSIIKTLFKQHFSDST